MRPLSIEGIGILCARGRGIEEFDTALRAGWVPPLFNAEGRPAYRINAEDLADREVLTRARRADRFSKMTVLAAYDALVDGGSGSGERLEMGIIVATALGAHASIFRFLDDIIDFGEFEVSPTTFVHTLHNAAASYATSVLGCQGPTVTVTQFYFAFHEALQVAYAWLAEGRVERVLVGVTEECSPAMEYIYTEKMSIAYDGRMRPLSCSPTPTVVPGEGSAFFLLSFDETRSKYGCISEIDVGPQRKAPDGCNLYVIGANAMGGSEEFYEQIFSHGINAAAYSDLYGGMMSGAAFECAAGALMLKNQLRYGSTVLGKPVTWCVSTTTRPYELDAILCVAHNPQCDLAFLKMIDRT